MNLNELGEFSDALSEAARVVTKSIGEKEIKAIFNYLISYPLKVILKAIDRALRKRDPDDIFQKTLLLTGQEIEQAAQEIIEETIPKETPGRVKGCPVCEGAGWLTFKDEEDHLLAYPCKCLYESALEALKKKKRPGSPDARLDSTRKGIVAAYEFHEKHWSGT